MTTKISKKRRAIMVFVKNRPGVLNKISMLIRRKMYNVESITACAARQRDYSRITLTLFEDNDANMLQVIRQIEKMTEVISARELDRNESFWREVALVKFEASQSQFEQLGNKYRFEVLDPHNVDVHIVQLAGISQMIDDFLMDLGDDKIIEVARSGFTALDR
ncbi:acetolactate synthase small subunit [bacterium]|nr:acetolactate synthase small subunit [bacterium]